MREIHVHLLEFSPLLNPCLRYFSYNLRRYTHRYGTRGRQQRFFLVAQAEGAIQGFVIGEVRDWEFGSPPSGWIFAINVSRSARQHGLGTQLFDAICDRFRAAGVRQGRTMIAKEDKLVLSFFRSHGLMAGPFIELEKGLQP